MQHITEKELRMVAPVLGHEVSFKVAREMAESSHRAKAGKQDEPINFVTFLTMVAFKLGFDCAFVLAYTTIMLNTDAHNDKLKGQKRLTCAEFIANNRRSPDLASIPDSYFEQLYKEIVSNEIKMEGAEAEDAVADESFSQDLRQSMALDGAPQVDAAAAVRATGAGSSDGWESLGITPGQAAGDGATDAGGASTASEPRAEEGVPPASAASTSIADDAANSASEADDDDGEPASKKLEKLVKAHKQGALSQEMFHRLVNKATSELPPTEPLRLKLEKLHNALDAGALTPDMFGKMLVKQISAAVAEAEAAAEQAKLLAMFAQTTPAATPAVDTTSEVAAEEPRLAAEELAAGTSAEPVADAVQMEVGEGEGSSVTVHDGSQPSDDAVHGDC
jgi:hypothetical protein